MASAPQRLDLPAEPSSVREARNFVRAVLVDLGLSDAVDVVTLLVSELATNAVLHARTAYAVVLSVQGTDVRVEVLDGSQAIPRQRHSSTSASTGRGVALVEQLSSTWGTTRPAASGFAKGVWFTVPASGGDDAAWSGDWLEGL